MYIPGDPWAICDLCGFKFRISKLRKNYKGQMVCKEDFETRHPSERNTVVRERGGVRDARKEQPDRFVGTVTADDL
jgi:hypothetical protein